MKTKLDKLASFRINSERWEKFKEVAEVQGKTATDLLNEYIDRVIGVGVGVDAAPKLSIRDIDKRIDDKINTASIQDIDDTVKKLIADSLEDGIVGEAIAKSYAAMMGQFNELLIQMEELKAAIPQSPVTSPQSTVPNHQLPVTSEEVINFLGIADILDGDPYWEDKLIESGINQKIVDNVRYLSEKLNIKVSPKGYAIARFNLILDALGYVNKKQGQHTKPNSKKQDKYIAVRVAR